jgi:predicted nicotinamide N-methyase
MATSASESDADQHKFIRSLFTSSTTLDDDGDDEEEDDDISQHSWICPNNPSISILYHLTIYAPGHGNRIWNSSACIAQHLLIPGLRSIIIDSSSRQRTITRPPTICLEFGAGAALPSLALLHEGAHRVILTDSALANNRTFDALHESVHANAKVWNILDDELSHRVKIMPHTWGNEIEEVRRVLGNGIGGDSNSLADLLIASDCIYNPTHHTSLLQSADGLLSSNGLFIVGYSLHGNVPPDQILDFFDIAKRHFGLEIVNECMRKYDGQEGIGSDDPIRGVVYIKVLARVSTVPVH